MIMIRANDIVRAVFAPLTELTILLPILMFWGLIAFAAYRLPLGVLILILSLPPLFRYQSFIVEAYASGRVPGAFDAEYFSWVGTGWTMFPLFLAVALGYLGVRTADAWGETGAWLAIVVSSVVVPASLAVLAITHSWLQAMNPVAILRLYDKAGPLFIVAPVYMLLLIGLTVGFGSLPLWAIIGAGIFMLYSLASVTGTLIAPFRLVEDVYIPDSLEPDDDKIAGDLQQRREAALAHAYGFISRNNRDGGFKHVLSAIAEDPDPVAAWDWYLKAMFLWEDKIHALFFAQRYVHDALAHGEDLRALKVTMRCYHESEQFKPLREDRPALIEAAERTGNTELAAVLKRG
jgi:hypothetical protein